MNYKEYVNKNKEIQNKLLLFVDKEDDIEENYNNLIEFFTNYKIINNPHELRSLLYLTSNISTNHYQTPSFISKIELLLEFLKEPIKKNYTNQKIFDIFKRNKRILLILIEHEIIIFDQTILNEISSKKYFRKSYYQFFFPEIQPLIEELKIDKQIKKTNFIDEIEINGEYYFSEYNLEYHNVYDFCQTRNFQNLYNNFSKKLPDNFLKERKIGQNEDEICKLIREDLIDEFITYVSKNDYPLNSLVEKSIYETNDFLNKQYQTRLIEYAAFFGSTQIFKYLYKNGVELTSLLWIYGIHSDNPEIIHLLEENEIKPQKSYEECIKESIKCHHNDITNYILSNYVKEDIENIEKINFEANYNENIYSYSFHYYNFAYFPSEIDHKAFFYYACEYDYIDIVEHFIKTKKIDIKEKIIKTNIFNQILS